jgi:hypothetical protein
VFQNPHAYEPKDKYYYRGLRYALADTREAKERLGVILFTSGIVQKRPQPCVVTLTDTGTLGNSQYSYKRLLDSEGNFPSSLESRPEARSRTSIAVDGHVA